MNRRQYNSDSRYRKLLEQMDLLGIMDITTTRQAKNGTIVWKLPIKDQDSGILIEVASFKTGYVRNQGKSTRSNFQLNKRCESEPEFFDSGKKDSMGRPLYTQWTTRTCKLIPIEIDRLEYLISYCLKNYYIKNANSVAEGRFIPNSRSTSRLTFLFCLLVSFISLYIYAHLLLLVNRLFLYPHHVFLTYVRNGLLSLLYAV